jgi:HEPN domain-containing protein
LAINIEKQKKHWPDGAVSDLETAEILIEKDKLLEGLFFCHLAIEKEIKARVVEATEDIPPKTHNLIRLSELASLSLTEKQAEFFGEMMMFHLEGRYPEDYRATGTAILSYQGL